MTDPVGRLQHGRPSLHRWTLALLRPSGAGQDSPGSKRLRRSALVAVGVVALAAGLFRIDVPAPWADEAATVLAVQRPWSGLWALAGGQDAPLLFFYSVAKAWADLLGWLPTLVAVRTLSAVAGAATAMVVFSVVVRRLGVLPAVLTAGLLISLPGFTRWCQDARPYALLMLLASAAWLAWDTWPRPDVPTDTGRGLIARWGHWLRGGWGLVVLLGLSATTSLFAGFAWPAMLAADLVAPRATRAERWHRVRQDTFLMAVALVVFSVPIWTGITMGRGPNTGSDVSLGLIVDRLVQLLVALPQPLVAAPIALLVAVGVAAAFVRRGALPTRLIATARMAMMWASVPLALSLALGVARPSLFRARYLVPVLAPTTVLAVIGALALGWALRLLLTRVLRRPSRSDAAAVLGGIVATVIVLGQVVVMLPTQRAVRATDGHDVSVTAMTSYVDHLLTEAPDEPVVTEADVVHAYLNCVRPDLAAREIAFVISPGSSWVWPQAVPAADLHARLSREPRAIWVTPVNWVGAQTPTRLPDAWADTGLRIDSAERRGSFWVMQLGRD